METTQEQDDTRRAARAGDYAFHYPMADERCQGWVSDWRRHLDHQCDKHATVVIEGRRYCRRHTPDKLAQRVQYFLRRRRRPEAAALCARYGKSLADVVRGGVSSGAAITRAQLEVLERMALGQAPQNPRERLLLTSAIGLLRKNVGGIDEPGLDGAPLEDEDDAVAVA